MSLSLGKIGLVGPGAIGGYYGGMLAHAGQDVHFLFHSTYEDVLRDGLSLVHHAEDKRVSRVEPLQAYQSAADIGLAIWLLWRQKPLPMILLGQ